MGKPIDLTGKVFGRLTVLELLQERGASGDKIWMCKCSCGTSHTVAATSLNKGNTKSCGCWARDWSIKKHTTHGKTKTKEYRSWDAMIQRCYNPKDISYKNYGGRGIIVCNEWRDSFEAFFADLGPKPSTKHTLDRVDNSKSYYKENCKWATYGEQMRHTRRNRYITYKEKTLCLKDWATKLKIHPRTLHKRLSKLNWPIDKALNYGIPND